MFFWYLVMNLLLNVGLEGEKMWGQGEMQQQQRQKERGMGQCCLLLTLMVPGASSSRSVMLDAPEMMTTRLLAHSRLSATVFFSKVTSH